MRIGSLFSGAGGLDMAVEAAFGGEVIWQSEYDKAASKVLAYRYPCAPNLGDITQIDWKTVETPDVLCGGWPCQPFSLAGKQRGIHDERALWPFVARAVCVLRPRFVVLENVPAVLSAGEFDRVAADLAQAGYEFAWTCFRASDIGAPHRRERLFVVATDTNESGWQGDILFKGRHEQAAECSQHALTLLPTPRTSDTNGPGLHGDGGIDLRTAAVSTQWGKYEPAIRHWEKLTRRAPAPTEPNKNGNPRLSASFSEWMMGWPHGWVTDANIGISRSDQLKIVGNGVVPLAAEAAIRYLLNASEVAA